MNIKEQCLRIALAELAGHEEPYKHWAFVIVKNKIVAWSKNTSGIPPKRWWVKASNWMPKRHAEMLAIFKARPVGIFDMVNIRLNNHCCRRLSAPCACCYTFAKQMGCRHIHFTTETGWARIT